MTLELPPPVASGPNVREIVWGVKDVASLDQLARALSRDRDRQVRRDGAVLRTTDIDGNPLAFRVTRRTPLSANPSLVNVPGMPPQRAVNSVQDFTTPIRPLTFSHFHVRDHTAMMLAGKAFADKGWSPAWGPGRHIFGGNCFRYFKSPFGGNVEYDADMDVVDDHWVTREAVMGPATAAACSPPCRRRPSTEVRMKLVLLKGTSDGAPRPGLLTERGIVDISTAVERGAPPQAAMVSIIDRFDDLRPTLDRVAETATALDPASVRLCAPMPRPVKILACIGNYWEHAQREPKPLNMFMKNPHAVVGPGDTIRLPNYTVPSSFMHEAELAVVIKGPAKEVPRDRWRDAVFGYTCLIDVTARGEGRFTWPGPPMSWLGKPACSSCAAAIPETLAPPRTEFREA